MLRFNSELTTLFYFWFGRSIFHFNSWVVVNISVCHLTQEKLEVSSCPKNYFVAVFILSCVARF